MVEHGIPTEYAYLARTGTKQPAHQAYCGRFAGTVGTDQAEHLAAPDVERDPFERAGGAVLLRHARELNGVTHCSGNSASTGIPAFKMPSRLSTLTLMRYTSFERSSAVWTVRGVNSACGEM